MLTATNLEHAGKLTGYLLGIIYAIGVLVVNLRLAQFGISGTGLLQEQYIFAGAWAILAALTVPAIVGTLIGFVINMYEKPAVTQSTKSTTDMSWKQRAGAWLRRVHAMAKAAGAGAHATVFLTFLGVVFFSFAMGTAIPSATKGIKALEVLIAAGEVAAFTVGMGIFGALAVSALRGAKSMWNYFLAVAASLTAALVLLWYLSFFAVSIYARIPSSIGGGAATPVRLALNPEEAKRLGISSKDTETLQLLFVTSSMYYFVSPRNSSRAVGVPSSAVRGIETVR